MKAGQRIPGQPAPHAQTALPTPRSFAQEPGAIAPAGHRLGRIASGLEAPVQRRGRLPSRLRASLEQMSGVSLADVQVHTGSREPAAVDADAFAQGNQIHLGPGAERHLAHEAWHVVQQKRGRVRATGAVASRPLNDSPALELEAERMGARALAMPAQPASAAPPAAASRAVS